MKKWILIIFTLIFLAATIITLGRPEASSTIQAYGQKEESSIEAVQAVTVDRDTIKTGFLDVISAYYPGTAGSSLKRVIAVVNVLEFSVENKLAQVNRESFAAELNAAWDEMTEEEKELFPELLASVTEQADEALQSFDSWSGLFEDAGVLEKMQQLMREKTLLKDWEALKEYVQTSKAGS